MGPYSYYVHTLPGIEGIAWEEIQQLCPGVQCEGFKIVPQRNGLTLFRTDADPSLLLKIRTAEDLFWVAAHIPEVPWGREGLSMLYDRLVHNLTLEPGLALLRRLRPLRIEQPIPFRVISRIVSKNQPYRRSDLAKMVSKAVFMATRKRWQATEGAMLELWANLIGRDFILGLRLSDETMRHRPYQQVHLPATLRPSVAAAMVRLTKPTPTDVFLDPMCGTGTILIERALYGRHRLLVGGDIDVAALRAAQENFGPRHKPRELLEWDAKRLPLASQSIDRAATNLPFGKQLSRPSELPALYQGVVDELARVLKPGGRAVMLTSENRPLQAALQNQEALILVRRYSINLLGQPATIHVLERKRF